MEHQDGVFTRISNQYYKFTEAERKVADYVVIHQRDTQFMSISELAEACGVADATIFRFCRRLNYKGYTAFKLAVANSDTGRAASGTLAGKVSPEDSIPDLCQKVYHNNMEALDQSLALVRPEAIMAAAELLARARRVLCMGQGGSMILAMEAAHLFSTAMPGFTAVWDSHLQTIAAANLSPEDVVLFFSYSGSTRELMDLLPIIRERKAKVILITHFPKSPAAAFADVILQCGANEGPLQHGSVPAKMAQLFLIDVLFAQVRRENEALCGPAKERVDSALATKHI